MKKLLLFSLSVFLLFSCNGNIETKDSSNQSVISIPYEDGRSLGLYSNVSSIQNNTRTVGAPIINVLLKFTNTGNYTLTDGTVIKPQDRNSFSLYYIFGSDYNGDGMEYNYVLYVPEGIIPAYERDTGKIHVNGNGNPFWWYTEKYLGLDITEIRDDWYATLDLLLDADSLPIPDGYDKYEPVEPGIPIEPESGRNLFERSESGFTIPGLGVKQLAPKKYSNVSGEYENIDGSDFALFYSGSDKEKWSYTIICPDSIYEEYAKYDSAYEGNSGNPFWKYLEVYYGLNMDTDSSEILSAISKGSFIVPDAEDYR